MSDYSDETMRPLATSEWFLTILILALPLVNIVMYIYWAVADGVNLNKRNFCRASIAWGLIGLGIAFFAVMMGGLGLLLGGD